METAGNRSKEISVPSWNDIENMRDRSFPQVSFKYIFEESSSFSSIEYYHLQNREPLLTNKCNCPNQYETAKQDIHSMISYTPQKVAMLNMSNPSNEHKILQKKVETYVKKLSF